MTAELNKTVVKGMVTHLIEQRNTADNVAAEMAGHIAHLNEKISALEEENKELRVEVEKLKKPILPLETLSVV